MGYRCVAWLLGVMVSVAGAGVAEVGAAELEVGLAVREITPEVGYPTYRGESTGVETPLQAKALVLRQGETEAALILCDVLGVPRELVVRIRRRVADETGLAFEHIGVAATHTHTGPDYFEDLFDYVEAEEAGELTQAHRAGYIARLIGQASEAGIAAYEDARPTEAELVRAEEAGVSFNRRFLMSSGQVRFNPGVLNPRIVRSVGPIDPEVLAVIFRGAEGEGRGGLTNFANHLDTVGGSAFNADYPHYIEQVLREELGEGFVSAFGLGAAGDLNHINVTRRERLSTREIGEAVGAAVREGLDEAEAEEPTLGVASRTVLLPMQGYTAEELAWAEGYMDGERDEALYPERGFLQLRRAMKIVSLRDLRERWAIPPAVSGEPWMLPVEVQAIRLSEQTAIVTMPGEVFVELGLDLKRRSPFRHTLPIELANASIAYVPTRRGFREGDYEAINSRLAPGGGEAMIDAAVELLEELAE